MPTELRTKLIENLRDCNCEDATIDRFLTMLDAGEKKQALTLLATHRKDLLDLFHQCNEHICCLDYLVNQIEKYEVCDESHRT